MILDEQFVLMKFYDVDERYLEDDIQSEEDMRELNFGNVHDENVLTIWPVI